MQRSWFASHFRVARHTNRLDDLVRFYEVGLGLSRVAEFHDHDGYDGVMLGLPDVRYHLEFTQHEEPETLPPPNPDNLMVFYIAEQSTIDQIVKRIGEMGYHPVRPKNPYWAESVTIPDPDGWRIVLVKTENPIPAMGFATYQDHIEKFVKVHDIDTSIENRALDLVSEVGEVAKELLKGSAYGKRDQQITPELQEELGDALFSLLCLANIAKIDLDVALMQVLAKYENRLNNQQDMSSGH